MRHFLCHCTIRSGETDRLASSRRGVISFAVLLVLLMVSAGTARAQGPQLKNYVPVPHAITQGNTVTFQIEFDEPSGDVPTDAYVEVISPGGGKSQVKFNNDLTTVKSGTRLDAVTTPSQSGPYRFRFVVKDANGTATYPEGGDWLEFNVRPNWMPWAIAIGGVLLSFLVITTLTYQLCHKLFHATQTGSARAALMVGAICAVVSILYGFDWLTQPLAWIAGGLLIVLLLVAALVTH